ncbi:MAG: hypothetical protein ACLPLR_20740 [Terriglobales bacterium]
MFSKAAAICSVVLTVVFGSAAMFSQQAPAAAGSSIGLEFPVIMRQNVVAGKTPAGTKIVANLVVATLVNGVVIPRGAALLGEVTESVAKTKTDPSRLAIRMDSAEWKNGSAPIKLYLTAWYYPAEPMAAPNLSYEPPDAANSIRNWNGMGQYPDKRDPASTPRFPDASRDKDSSPLPSPTFIASKHRVIMKDVDSIRDGDGAVALTSKRSNLKVDKLTTYVLAKGDLLSAK